MTTEVDDFLEHYGVIGMHWGSHTGGRPPARPGAITGTRTGKLYSEVNASRANKTSGLQDFKRGVRILRGKETATRRQKVGAALVVGGRTVQAAGLVAGAAYAAHLTSGTLKLNSMERANNEAAKAFLNRNSKQLSNIPIMALHKASNGAWALP